MTTTTPFWLSTTSLCRESGATYRQVNYWTVRGFLHTLHGQTPGSGRRQRYPGSEIAVARVMRLLGPMQRHGSLVSDEQIVACAERVRRGERGVLHLGGGLCVDVDEAIA